MGDPEGAERFIGCEHEVSNSVRGGKPVRQLKYYMKGFLDSCVKRYLELSGRPDNCIKKVETPFLADDDRAEDDIDEGGELQPHAAKILMKVLYAARMYRFDLLKPVTYLASRITKWSKRCDLRLHRLMCYVNTTKDAELIGHIGDDASKIQLGVWSDADFAGCKVTMRSTSGTYMALILSLIHI